MSDLIEFVTMTLLGGNIMLGAMYWRLVTTRIALPLEQQFGDSEVWYRALFYCSCLLFGVCLLVYAAIGLFT